MTSVILEDHGVKRHILIEETQKGAIATFDGHIVGFIHYHPARRSCGYHIDLIRNETHEGWKKPLKGIGTALMDYVESKGPLNLRSVSGALDFYRKRHMKWDRAHIADIHYIEVFTSTEQSQDEAKARVEEQAKKVAAFHIAIKEQLAFFADMK